MEALLFDELLDRLEDEQFRISVTHRLRVHQLALALPEPVDLPSLRGWLRPVLATSPEEEQKFDAVFDEYIRGSEGRETRERRRRTSSDEQPGNNVTVVAKRGSGVMLFAAVVVVALIVYVATHDPKSGPAINTTTANTTTTDTTMAKPVTTATTIVGKAVSDSKPVETSESRRPKESPLRAALRVARPLLQGVAFVIAVALFYDLARMSARWILRRRTLGRMLPHRWPLNSADIADVFDTPAVDEAVRRLRRRAAGERLQLDLEASVRATAAAGRLATLVHAAARQSPRYVVLIERRSADDQLTEYFHALADALASREVELQVYDYEFDPRVCIDLRTGANIGIADIRQRHPGSRLLVMGSGEALVDPFCAELREWVESELEWRVRGALIPAWTGVGVEHALAPVMAVSRADAEGLIHVADMLDRGEHARHRISAFSDALDSPLGSNPMVRELRDALDPAVFRWLTACALHPELHWDITIRLGRLLLGTIDSRRLLQLVQLRWFREGAIPEERREQLAEVFRSDPACGETHLAIADILAEQTPPAHTYAAEVQAMRNVTHRILALPAGSAELRPLVRKLRAFSKNLVLGNDDLASHLAPPEAAPRISSIIFRGGTPALGVRNFIWTALLVTVGLLIAGTTVATTAWSYAEAPPRATRLPPPSLPKDPAVSQPRPIVPRTDTQPAPPLPYPATAPATTAAITATTISAPVTPPVVPAELCQVKIQVASPWSAEFGCVPASSEGQWLLTIDPISITFDVERTIRTNLYEIQPRIIGGPNLQLPEESRGTLRVGSTIYDAILIGGNNLRSFRAGPEAAPSEPCSGSLSPDLPQFWTARIDLSCAGTFEPLESGRLIAGRIETNFSIDKISQVPGSVELRLRPTGTLDPTQREYRMEVGERTYVLTLRLPERGIINLLVPPNNAKLPIEANQGVMLRWDDVRAEKYRLSVLCGDTAYNGDIFTNSFVWAPREGSIGQRCQWFVVNQANGVKSGMGVFTLESGELLEVDFVVRGMTVVVDGKIDGIVTRLTINGTEVPVENNRFRTELKMGDQPFAITTIATLADGSEIIDSQTARGR